MVDRGYRRVGPRGSPPNRLTGMFRRLRLQPSLQQRPEAPQGYFPPPQQQQLPWSGQQGPMGTGMGGMGGMGPRMMGMRPQLGPHPTYQQRQFTGQQQPPQLLGQQQPQQLLGQQPGSYAAGVPRQMYPHPATNSPLHPPPPYDGGEIPPQPYNTYNNNRASRPSQPPRWQKPVHPRPMGDKRRPGGGAPLMGGGAAGAAGGAGGAGGGGMGAPRGDDVAHGDPEGGGGGGADPNYGADQGANNGGSHDANNGGSHEADYGGGGGEYGGETRSERFRRCCRCGGGGDPRARKACCYVFVAIVIGLVIVAIYFGVKTIEMNNPHSSESASSAADVPLPGNQEKHSGDLTYFDVGLGSCGWTNTNSDPICAMSHITYDAAGDPRDPNHNPLCGRKIRIEYNGKTVDVTVVDRCEACAATDLDLSPGIFNQISPMSAGRIKGTWTWLD